MVWYYTSLSILNAIVFWLFNRATRENSRAIECQTETHGMLSDRVTNIYRELQELKGMESPFDVLADIDLNAEPGPSGFQFFMANKIQEAQQRMQKIARLTFVINDGDNKEILLPESREIGQSSIDLNPGMPVEITVPLFGRVRVMLVDETDGPASTIHYELPSQDLVERQLRWEEENPQPQHFPHEICNCPMPWRERDGRGHCTARFPLNGG